MKPNEPASPAQRASTPTHEPTHTMRYDAHGKTIRLRTDRRHVLQLEPFYHVAVRLVDCDHRPLPAQGTLLTLPDGSEHRPSVAGDGIVRFAPSPPGVCALTVDEARRVQVRFPAVADPELVIVVRVPPRALYGHAGDDLGAPDPFPHIPVGALPVTMDDLVVHSHDLTSNGSPSDHGDDLTSNGSPSDHGDDITNNGSPSDHGA